MKRNLLVLISFIVILKPANAGSILAKHKILHGDKNGNLSIVFTVSIDAESNESLDSASIRFSAKNKVTGTANKNFGQNFSITSGLPNGYSNRLTVEEKGNDYTLHVMNLKYNDDVTVIFKATFSNPDSVKSNQTRIAIIQGGPDEVKSQPIPSIIRIDESSSQKKVFFELEGNPRPTVTWNGVEVLQQPVVTIDKNLKQYRYTAVLRNINRTMDGKNVTIFASGKKNMSKISTLDVTWGPVQCIGDSPTQFVLGQTFNVTVKACGNPQPVATAKFHDVEISKVETKSLGKNQYSYTANLTNYLKPSRCGKPLVFTFISNNRSLSVNHSMLFQFTPRPVKIIEAWKNENCVHFKISPQDTGNCPLYYEIKLLDARNKTLKNITTKGLPDPYCMANVMFVGIRTLSNITEAEFSKETYAPVVSKGPGDSGGSSLKGAVIGAAIGAVALILLIICVVYLCLREKKRRGKENKIKSEGSPVSSTPLNNSEVQHVVYEDANYMSITNNQSNNQAPTDQDYIELKENSKDKRNKDEKQTKEKSKVDDEELGIPLAGNPADNEYSKVQSNPDDYVDARRIIKDTSDKDDPKHVYYEPAFRKNAPTKDLYAEVDKSKKKKNQKKEKDSNYDIVADTKPVKESSETPSYAKPDKSKKNDVDVPEAGYEDIRKMK